MLIIYVPYPNVQDLIFLPNPELGNGESSTHRLTLKRMMDSSVVTHTTRKNEKLRRFNFILNRQKSIEYLEFIKNWSGETVRVVTDYIDQIGFIKTNPTDLSIDGVQTVNVSLEIES